jgi:hypothetical protein
MGREVLTPCPISDLPHQILTPPSDVISNHAFGAKEAPDEVTAAAEEFARKGKWKQSTRLAPVPPEVFRKARRETMQDKGEAPEGSDAPLAWA